MLPLKTFLSVLFQYCDERNIGCCYGRLYASDMFTTPQRDIDIIVEKRHIPALVSLIHAWPNLKLLSTIEQTNTTQLYIYGIRQGIHTFLCLDIHHTLAYKGLDYLKPSAVILKAVPAACQIGLQPHELDLGLIYILTHIMKHKNVSADTVAVINRAFQSDRIEFENLLELYFGDESPRTVHQVTDGQATAKHIKHLKTSYLKRQSRQDRIVYTINRLTYAIRTTASRFTSHDIRIVVCGTDGSGKTYFINTLKPYLLFLRPRLVHAHGLPVLPWQTEPDSNQVNTQPHAQPNRSWIMSNLKLIYFWILFWLDAAWPHRGSRLIVYDRYYLDILIDPRRFRFAGSVKLALFILRHLPHIHGYIWLNTPPLTAYTRKPEVPIAIMEKQYEAYQAYFSSSANVLSLDGTHMTDNDIVSAVAWIAALFDRRP